MQRWNIIQHELIPELRSEAGALTPKLEQVAHTLEWVRIEEFVSSTWGGCGRPEHDRGMLANAFVAKAVLGLPTTTGLIERLAVDRASRRICGFSMWEKLPGESTFSRAFAEFAGAGLAERAHAALVRETLGDRLVRPYQPGWHGDRSPRETGEKGGCTGGSARSTAYREEETRSPRKRRSPRGEAGKA